MVQAYRNYECTIDIDHVFRAEADFLMMQFQNQCFGIEMFRFSSKNFCSDQRQSVAASLTSVGHKKYFKKS